MVFMVLQKRQEQNMAGKSQTDLQIWHSRGFLGVRLAFLHDINISASIFVCLDHFHSFDGSPLSRLYNHIQLSSNLMSGCDYSLFKVGLHLLSFLEPLRYSSAKNKYQTYPPGVPNMRLYGIQTEIFVREMSFIWGELSLHWTAQWNLHNIT